jgi:hypothetical protein
MCVAAILSIDSLNNLDRHVSRHGDGAERRLSTHPDAALPYRAANVCSESMHVGRAIWRNGVIQAP